MARLQPNQRKALVDELHELGLRATPARVGVLHAVRSVDTPITHAELAERLDDTGWDAATVYRNLMTLVDAGVVTRTDHGDHRWRFRAMGSDVSHEHPHFFCTDCGTVSCLPEVKVQLRRTTTLPRSARSRDVEVQLRGICDECAP